MMIVKHAENQGFPPKSLMDAITKLAEEETKAGTMIGTGGLLPTSKGASVRLANGKITVTDGPYAEAKEVIGGYYLIAASDYAAAVKISEGCPHLKYGGRIEVREIEQMG